MIDHLNKMTMNLLNKYLKNFLFTFLDLWIEVSKNIAFGGLQASSSTIYQIYIDEIIYFMYWTTKCKSYPIIIEE